MNALQAALEFILPHEGGYASDPDDPGLATKFGISLRFLRGPGLKLGDIDGDGDIDADDVRDLTVQKAVDIFQARFWKPLKLGSMPPKMAAAVMDTAVNMGPRTAIKLLQETLNDAGANLETDGICGEKTLRAVSVFGGGLPTIRAFLLQRVFRYRELVSDNSKLLKFLVGWIKRVEELERFVIEEM